MISSPNIPSLSRCFSLSPCLFLHGHALCACGQLGGVGQPPVTHATCQAHSRHTSPPPPALVPHMPPTCPLLHPAPLMPRPSCTLPPHAHCPLVHTAPSHPIMPPPSSCRVMPLMPHTCPLIPPHASSCLLMTTHVPSCPLIPTATSRHRRAPTNQHL
jgi:hypothetical protein